MSLAGLVLLAPASSQAAVTIGRVNPNVDGNNCDPGKVYAQPKAQIAYSVPSAGVITAWATRANGNGGQQAALKTLRQTATPPGAFTFSIQGTSVVQALTPGTLNSFLTRIPVQAGDLIGYYFPSGPEDSQACRYTAGSGSDETVGGPSTGQPGNSFTTTNDDFSSTKRLNLEATVEPDADRDGFGDESQDGCRGASGPNAGCPAGVTPTQPGTDTVKPRLGSLSFSRSTFAAAKSGSAFTSQRGRKKKRKTPTGTKVSFNLSEAASVKFTVQRKTSGRRSRGKCRTATRRTRRKPKCTLWKNVRGSFSVTGKAGKNSFTFRGRIGGKALRAGGYRLNGKATDRAKNKSVTKNKTFRIVK